MFRKLKRLFSNENKGGNAWIVCSKCYSTNVAVTTGVGMNKTANGEALSYGIKCRDCSSAAVFKESWETENIAENQERIFISPVTDVKGQVCPMCGGKKFVKHDKKLATKEAEGMDVFKCTNCNTPSFGVKRGDKQFFIFEAIYDRRKLNDKK